MTWKRSSACNTDHVTGNCVEACLDTDGLVRIRDSRQPDTVLALDPGDWSAFTAGIRCGDFDDLPTIEH